MAEDDTRKSPDSGDDKARIGADLIIPLAGLAFAAYYIWSIIGLPWTAQLNGFFLSGTLTLLVALLLVRTARQLSAGRAVVSFMDLAETPQSAVRRWGLFALAMAFTATIGFFGFTLAIFLFLVFAMLLLDVRPLAKILSVATLMATAGYLLFIVGLNARLPRGPIETFLAGLF